MTEWLDRAQRFNARSFTSLSALVAAPASPWPACLVNRTTGEVIGVASHDGTRWVLGDMDLARVSTTPYAVVASVDNGTTCTLTAGHNLTTGVMRLWNTSAGVSLGDVAGTVAGDTLTVPDTTGMAAGDQVWRTGVSEVELTLLSGAGRLVYGSGTLVTDGEATIVPAAYGTPASTMMVRGVADIVTATGGDNSFVGVGVRHSGFTGADRASAALFQDAGTWKRALLYRDVAKIVAASGHPGTPAGRLWPVLSTGTNGAGSPYTAYQAAVRGDAIAPGDGLGAPSGSPVDLGTNINAIRLSAVAATSGSMSAYFRSVRLDVV